MPPTTRTKNKTIDILSLNKIHLSNKTQFKLPNFHSYIIKRYQPKGKPSVAGTAIFINLKLIYHMTIKTTSLENTAVHSSHPSRKPRTTTLGCIQKSKNSNTYLRHRLFTRHIVVRYKMVGNLNAKHTTWTSRTDNIAGKILAIHLFKLRNVKFATPTTPLHYPDNINTVLTSYT